MEDKAIKTNQNQTKEENAKDELFVKYKHKEADTFCDKEALIDIKNSDNILQDNYQETSDNDIHKSINEKNLESSKKSNKIFEKYQVKDIVFLAIMSAIVLVTSAVMPLVIPLQATVFGIAQLVTGLQLSIFPAIAIMKVRKVGSMFFMSIFTGIIQLIMSPAMFVNNIVIGLILELMIILIFRGYKKDSAVFFAVALYNPLSLPFNYVYNLIIGNEVMTAVADKAPWMAVGMSAAVLAVSVIGTLIGIRISKELKKAGVFKK